MGGWTAVGQTLDTKSSLCPMSVRILSKVCPMEEKVQGLSSRCLTDVEILSKSIIFGQRLDKKIQHLSTGCPMEHPIYLQTLFDIIWDWHTLDKNMTWCHSSWALASHSQILDNVWTDIVLDKLWTKYRFKGPTLSHTQTLDIVWKIMGYGQTLELSWISLWEGDKSPSRVI